MTCQEHETNTTAEHAYQAARRMRQYLPQARTITRAQFAEPEIVDGPLLAPSAPPPIGLGQVQPEQPLDDAATGALERMRSAVCAGPHSTPRS